MSRYVLTILAVADLERAAGFYRRAFHSWTVSVEVPVYVEFTLPGGPRFGVYQRESFAHNTGVLPQALAPGATTGTEVYLSCEDLPQAEARLLEAGARLLSPAGMRSWGEVVAYYADPDGNVLALAAAGS